MKLKGRARAEAIRAEWDAVNWLDKERAGREIRRGIAIKYGVSSRSMLAILNGKAFPGRGTAGEIRRSPKRPSAQ